MDAAQLREALEASRRFEVDYGRAHLRLRLPTEVELRRIYREQGESAPAEEVARAVATAAVYGWEGVDTALLTLGAVDQGEVLFDPGLLQVWMDDDPGLAEAITAAVWQRITARREARAADRKNSPTGSNSTATEPAPTS